jgi:hypothetical protein
MYRGFRLKRYVRMQGKKALAYFKLISIRKNVLPKGVDESFSIPLKTDPDMRHSRQFLIYHDIILSCLRKGIRPLSHS